MSDKLYSFTSVTVQRSSIKFIVDSHLLKTRCVPGLHTIIKPNNKFSIINNTPLHFKLNNMTE